jgi:hypothetical protein
LKTLFQPGLFWDIYGMVCVSHSTNAALIKGVGVINNGDPEDGYFYEMLLASLPFMNCYVHDNLRGLFEPDARINNVEKMYGGKFHTLPRDVQAFCHG